MKVAKKKNKTASATIANAGLEAQYRRRIMKLVNAMAKDISSQVGKVYNKREDEITEDETPAKQLTRLINRRMVKWSGIFDKESKKLARWFVKRADSSTKAQLGRSLSRAAGITVKFKTTEEVEDVLDSLIAENVSLIKSIQEQYHTQVNTEVMDSVRSGRDLNTLADTLKNRYAITARRAKNIAKDQNNKATESISLERNKSLGITEGDWMHRAGSKQPRKSHQQANGKRFKLSEGLLIDGEYIFPGQKPYCNCSYRPVIPGFN